MITETRHTIVLELPKMELPLHDNFKEFILTKIADGHATVDYFGGELDHCFDCEADIDHDHDFQNRTYVSFHFKAFLDTATDKESALELLASLLHRREILEIRQDDKDVDVFI